MSDDSREQERQLFRFLMENIPDRIYFKDRTSRFICVNAAMARLFGVGSPEEVVGKSDFDFFPRDDAQRMFEDEQRVLESGDPLVGKVEKKLLPDGSTGWTITTKLPLRGADGIITGTCGISRDITALMAAETALEQERNRLSAVNSDLAHSQTMLERKLAELEKANTELKLAQRRLIGAEKAQSLARLALGVAHEVKNPLAILTAGVDFFSSNLEPEENAMLVLQEMSGALRRADNIINEMMVFADSAEIQTKPAQVSAVIDSALATHGPALDAAGVVVERRYAKGLPAARIDEAKMKRVFECIIENALHAMPAGGTLTISLGITQIPAPAANDPGNRSLAHSGIRRIGLLAEFDDTGAGIPADKLADVFDPFFTTKPTGQGTGLGLTVSRKIVELHGGTLDVVNRATGGVSARVLIKV